MVSPNPNISVFKTTDLLFSCDWGTSSFRLGLIDRDSEEVLYSRSTRGGIKKLDHEWKQQINSSTRESFFLNYLEQQIQQLGEQISRPLNKIPVISSGMVSSSIGMYELPYASVPFSLKKPVLPQKLILQTNKFPRDLLIISGIRTAKDVMRGEEVQLVGLDSDHELKNAICVIPGTHSKHVFVEDNTVVDFKTYMSGELFELLCSHSVLAASVQDSEQPLNIDAFHEGLEEARQKDFLHAIFGIRTNDLLLGLHKRRNLDLLSGLVIGTEIQSLTELDYDRGIYLAGSGPLIDRYQKALQFMSLQTETIVQPDRLTLKGHLRIINSNS
ncbi:MAG: 2-dehydro-3-deoxygalactonokinase [Balneolaceae bacterium]|nr:2-dehydro-3-deoxygalactonokinase [Balneolaceae bacterium]